MPIPTLMASHAVIGYNHIWGEFCAHLIDDEKTPFLACQADREMRTMEDRTAFLHENGNWYHVAIDIWHMEREMRHANYGTEHFVLATYYTNRDALQQLMNTDHTVWPEHRLWIEEWEFKNHLRTSLPVKDQIKERMKRRRIRVRDDNTERLRQLSTNNN